MRKKARELFRPILHRCLLCRLQEDESPVRLRLECTNWATSFLSIKETSETEKKKFFFAVVIYIFSYKNSFYKLNSKRCYWHEYIRTLLRSYF